MQRIKNSRLLGALLSLLLIPLFTACEARGDGVLSVQQARISGGRIAVYFDLVGGDGKPVAPLAKENFLLFFDDKPLRIEKVAPFAKSGEGIAAVLLIDASRSMRENHFAQAKKALEIWVDSMSAQDMTAILSFGETADVVAPFTNDRTRLKEAIDGLQRGAGETRVHEAVAKAYETASLKSEGLPFRRAIVALSDGIQETEPTISLEDLLATIRGNRIPFHSIAYVHNARNDREKILIRNGLQLLERLSSASGGAFHQVSGGGLLDAYAGVNSRIRNGCVLTGDLSVFKGDDLLHGVRVEYRHEGAALSAEMDVVYRKADGLAWRKYLLPAAAAAVVLLLAAALYLLKRRRKRTNAPVETGGALATDASPPKAEKPKPSDDPAKIAIRTKPRAVEITLTPVGEKNAEPYAVKLTDRVSIGRSKDCGVRIADDSGVSAKHCELLWSEGKLYVQDLGSTNGTSVNGVPITGLFSLNDGDCLGVGRVTLRVGISKET